MKTLSLSLNHVCNKLTARALKWHSIRHSPAILREVERYRKEVEEMFENLIWLSVMPVKWDGERISIAILTNKYLFIDNLSKKKEKKHLSFYNVRHVNRNSSLIEMTSTRMNRTEETKEKKSFSTKSANTGGKRKKNRPNQHQLVRKIVSKRTRRYVHWQSKNRSSSGVRRTSDVSHQARCFSSIQLSSSSEETTSHSIRLLSENTSLENLCKKTTKQTIQAHVTVLTREVFSIIGVDVTSTVVRMKRSYQMNPNIPKLNDSRIGIDPEWEEKRGHVSFSQKGSYFSLNKRWSLRAQEFHRLKNIDDTFVSYSFEYDTQCDENTRSSSTWTETRSVRKSVIGQSERRYLLNSEQRSVLLDRNLL